MITCYLEITTWIGTSIGATHYYGNLWCQGKDVELKHPLSEKQAARMNKYNREAYGLSTEFYHPGDLYYGYDHKTSIVKQAIREWTTRFPNADRLVEGKHYYADSENKLLAKREGA